MEKPSQATECHLPYGITQCYLSPDTGEHTLLLPQPSRPVHYIILTVIAATISNVP